jgi:hypothetical protein
MNDGNEVDRGLVADLAALRGALREVHASEADEGRLIAALHARRAVRLTGTRAEHAPAATERTAWRGRTPFALAAAAAVAAVTAMLTLRVEQGGVPELARSAAPPDTPASAAPVESADPPDHAGAFQPLAFSSGLSASQSYSVVRVRIPLTALTPGYAVPLDATIEADLLVGEDGLASGIRFNNADTLFVSTGSSEMGESR